MKIAFIELDKSGHTECLNSFCKIFEGFGESLSLYTTQKIENELKGDTQLEEFNWLIKSDDTDIKEFLNKNLPSINQHDVIIFNTVQNDFRDYIGYAFKPPTILRLHNIHTYSDKWKHLTLKMNFIDLGVEALYLLNSVIPKSEWSYAQKFIQTIDFVSFPDIPIEEYAKDNQLFSPSKIFPCIPLACNMKESDSIGKDNSRFFEISIPGLIDRNRKDYQLVVDVFKQVVSRFSRPVRLNLLGRPRVQYGTNIIKSLNSLQNEYFELRSYTSRISQEEFNRIMYQTDLILSPIVINTRHHFFHEIYGKSKLSGSISDVIRYAVPAILPSEYVLNDTLNEVIETYNNSEEFANSILNFVNNPETITQKITAIQKLKINYSPDSVREDILENLQKIIQ